MHDFHTHFIPTDVLNWLKENKNRVNAEWINKGRKERGFSIHQSKMGI